jgi:hypothetical protein
MTDYYWCLTHEKVEPDADRCASANALGPYATADEAAHALDRVAQRNDAWDEEDKRWKGEPEG